MPANVQLTENDRIAIVTWENPVSVDDFMKVFAIMEPVYQRTEQPVHSIYLADHLNNLPPRAISTYLKDARSPLVHPKSGLMIVVSGKLFIRAITDTAAKMVSAGKLYTAVTQDEAMAKIRAHL